MTEHETPENPPQAGPETPNEQPEMPAAATGPAAPAAPVDPTEQAEQAEQAAPTEPTAPRYPGIPPAQADPLQTLPGPNTAGYLPGGHQLPTGEPQPTPFDPDRGYAPGPVPAPSPLDPALAPGVFPEPTPDGFGPKKKLPTWALIGIIAGGIIAVLVLAAVIIIPLANRGGGGANDSGTRPGPAAATPEEFVEGYLNAVAAGDAEAAIEYVSTGGYSKDLLTDEVLEASLELGAIDDIEVGKASEGVHADLSVPVTFTVGGEEVSRDFEVYQSDYDGEISMYGGLTTVEVYGFEGIGVTVNGVELAESAYAFPGTYEFGVGLDGFAIDGEAVRRLVTDADDEALYDLKPTLSDEGLATFRERVSTSLRECLAMSTLSTPCGFDVTGLEKDGYTPVDGTIARTMSAEGETALANLEPRISERAVVTTSDYIAIEVTFTGQNAAGQQGQFKVIWGSQMLAPKVDFAAETPTVVWE